MTAPAVNAFGRLLTVVVGFTHVGEKVLNLLADDHVGYVVDRVADNVVTSTNSYSTNLHIELQRGFSAGDIGRLTEGHSLTLQVGRSVQNDIGSRVIALLVPTRGASSVGQSASTAQTFKPS
jgi:hypothetical protein